MEEILIEITFDEDRFRNGIWILRSQNDNKHWEDLNFKELHLPTEGEIAGIIKDESGMKLSYAKALNCARLIINQMKGEE